MKGYQIQEAFCSKLRLQIISNLVSKKLLFTELKKLTNASDGNLSVQLKKLEGWEYIKSEKKLINGKGVTQYQITETGIKQFEEYVVFLESVIADIRTMVYDKERCYEKDNLCINFNNDSIGWWY